MIHLIFIIIIIFYSVLSSVLPPVGHILYPRDRRAGATPSIGIDHDTSTVAAPAATTEKSERNLPFHSLKGQRNKEFPLVARYC